MEMETVWHGALWREGPQPVLAEPSPSKPYVRKQQELLTPAKAEVFEVVNAKGPMTRNQVCAELRHRTWHSVSTALDRLYAEERIEKCGKVRMTSRNLAWLYRVREGQ